MYCFAVREKNHPEIAILSLGDQRPSPDSAVCLHDFFDRGVDCAFDPLVTDGSPVWAYPNRIKVAGGPHFTNVTETTDACCCGLTIELSAARAVV